MQAGHLLVLPVEGQVDFDGQGRMRRSNRPWPPPYRPSISTAAQAAALQWGERLCFIVLTGMGDDGADAAMQVRASGAEIWVQAGDDVPCASQPQAMQGTGLVGFAGTPLELAHEVSAWLRRKGAVL